MQRLGKAFFCIGFIVMPLLKVHAGENPESLTPAELASLCDKLKDSTAEPKPPTETLADGLMELCKVAGVPLKALTDLTNSQNLSGNTSSEVSPELLEFQQKEKEIGLLFGKQGTALPESIRESMTPELRQGYSEGLATRGHNISAEKLVELEIDGRASEGRLDAYQHHVQRVGSIVTENDRAMNNHDYAVSRAIQGKPIVAVDNIESDKQAAESYYNHPLVKAQIPNLTQPPPAEVSLNQRNFWQGYRQSTNVIDARNFSENQKLELAKDNFVQRPAIRLANQQAAESAPAWVNEMFQNYELRNTAQVVAADGRLTK